MANYFKNTELAARYNISEATVRNWVKSTKEGKLPLELATHNGRDYVANSISNIPIIRELIKQNRKYRNTLAAKTIKPNPAFYKIFNDAQVYDIVRNLELHHEVPIQYSYFGKGAEIWAEYTSRQVAIDVPSMPRRTIELLAGSYSYIDERLAKFKKINVIDIGVGNALPVKNLLAHLLGAGKLGRYVAIDFSDDMLKVARRHLVDWFGDQVKFEGYTLDMAHERFANILAEDYLKPERDTVNLVLCLGSTPSNLRMRGDAFRTICESMNPQDLFIYTGKLGKSDALPEWVEFEIKHGETEGATQHRLVYGLLNIDKSYYDLEVGFDEILNQRYERARLKVAVKLTFDVEEGERTLQFEKGDTIIVWRCWQTTPHNLVSLLEDTGFYVLHSSQSEDHNYILTIAEVQRS